MARDISDACVYGKEKVRACPGEEMRCPPLSASIPAGQQLPKSWHSRADAPHLSLEPLTQLLRGQMTRSPTWGKAKGDLKWNM